MIGSLITLTAFCHCAKCNTVAGQPTASTRMPKVGITIAAPRNVPFGTWVRIEGIGWRRVDDRTARRYDGRWDLFMGSGKGAHDKAKRFGLRKVRILEQRKAQ